MRAVAERLVVAVAATTERDRGSSRQIELVLVLIKDFEISFQPHVAAVVDGNFSGHHEFSVAGYCFCILLKSSLFPALRVE